MTQGLWIAIGVVAVLVLVAALVLGLARYRRRRIRLSPSSRRPEPGALDRSGGYTASAGITFSQSETLEPTGPPVERIDTRACPLWATTRPSRAMRRDA